MDTEGKNVPLSAQYIVGLTEGEGCFCCVFRSNEGRIDLRFFIAQAEGNLSLLQKVHEFFKVGTVYRKMKARGNKLPAFVYESARREDVYNVIIPFFKKHRLLGIKAKSFEDFCEIASIIKGRPNITKLSAEEVQRVMELKYWMNKRYGSPGAENPLAGSLDRNQTYVQFHERSGNAL